MYLMNKLKDDCFFWSGYKYLILQILVNIQIFTLVSGNSPSTCPEFKSEYLYIHL